LLFLFEALFGKEPFSAESIGREYADIVGKGEKITKKTAIFIGLFAGGINFMGGRGVTKSLKESAKILKKLDDPFLIKNELKRVGITGDKQTIDDLAKVLSGETDEKVIFKTLDTLSKPAVPKGLQTKKANVIEGQKNLTKKLQESGTLKVGNEVEVTSDLFGTQRGKVTAYSRATKTTTFETGELKIGGKVVEKAKTKTVPIEGRLTIELADGSKQQIKSEDITRIKIGEVQPTLTSRIDEFVKGKATLPQVSDEIEKLLPATLEGKGVLADDIADNVFALAKDGEIVSTPHCGDKLFLDWLYVCWHGFSLSY